MSLLFFFFFNDPATTEIYTLSLHDALPISGERVKGAAAGSDAFFPFPDGPTLLLDAGVTAIIHPGGSVKDQETIDLRSEEHTSELQSHVNLVCRLLLEKKKTNTQIKTYIQS